MYFGSRPGAAGPAPGPARLRPGLSPSFLKRAVTFIYPLPSDCMQTVVSSKKMENGIVVFWEEKGVMKSESFNYKELVDMKINALDLLERPLSLFGVGARLLRVAQCSVRLTPPRP